MAAYGRGLICLPMAGEIVDRLDIPQMVTHNASRWHAFTRSIRGERGHHDGHIPPTQGPHLQVAVDEATGPEDLVMPGHVFPLRAKDGVSCSGAGQTEAAVYLARLAGFKPAGVICEIMKEDGTMARVTRPREVLKGARRQTGAVAQIIEYRHTPSRRQVRFAVETRLPTPFGEFSCAPTRTT